MMNKVVYIYIYIRVLAWRRAASSCNASQSPPCQVLLCPAIVSLSPANTSMMLSLDAWCSSVWCDNNSHHHYYHHHHRYQQQQQQQRGRDYRRATSARVWESALSDSYHSHAVPRRHSTPLFAETPARDRTPARRPAARPLLFTGVNNVGDILTSISKAARSVGRGDHTSALLLLLLLSARPIADTDSVLCTIEDHAVL